MASTLFLKITMHVFISIIQSHTFNIKGNQYVTDCLFAGRDDKIRTCDHTPPRRVRYQLRYNPFCGAKVWLFFVPTKFFL